MEPNPQPFLDVRAKPQRSYAPVLFILVAVAVLSALLAACFPVFASARQAAFMGRWLTNAKNSALSVQIYIGDSDERYPPGDRWVDLCEKPERELNFPDADRHFRDGAYHVAMNSRCSMKQASSFEDAAGSIALTFWSTKRGRNSTDFFESLQWTRSTSRYTMVGTMEGSARVVRANSLLGSRRYNGALGK